MTSIRSILRKFEELKACRGISRNFSKFDEKWANFRHICSFLDIHKYYNFQLFFRTVGDKTRPSWDDSSFRIRTRRCSVRAPSELLFEQELICTHPFLTRLSFTQVCRACLPWADQLISARRALLHPKNKECLKWHPSVPQKIAEFKNPCTESGVCCSRKWGALMDG